MSGTHIHDPNLLEELEKTPGQLALEEQVKQLQEALEQANKDKAALCYKLEQSQIREAQLGRNLNKEKKDRELDRRQYEKDLKEANESQAKSIVWPCILIAIFGALSLLVGLCVDKGWMVALLGQLLICLFLCVCSFFGGIVWSRTKK